MFPLVTLQELQCQENFNEIKGIQIDALQAADIAQLVGVKIK